MKNLNQLLLKFDLKQNYQHEDFYVSKSNFYAFNLINKWPKWEKNILNIHGEKYYGKSHLSNIFKKKYNAYKIQANEFNNENLKEFILNICNNSVRLLINYMEKFKLLGIDITEQKAKEICTNISFYEFENYTKAIFIKNDMKKAIKIIFKNNFI